MEIKDKLIRMVGEPVNFIMATMIPNYGGEGILQKSASSDGRFAFDILRVRGDLKTIACTFLVDAVKDVYTNKDGKLTISFKA